MDLTTLIVDLLRNKQENEAVHAGEQKMSPEQALALLRAQSTPMKPSPDMLGTGAAQRAGQKLEGRDAQIAKLVDESL